MTFSTNKRGFTILELLIATGVTVIVAGIMITIVSSVLTGWNRSSGSLSTNSQARLVLDVLADDFQSALYRPDGNVWMAATIENRNTLTSPGNNGHQWEDGNHRKPDGNDSINLMDGARPVDLREARFGFGGVWLRFFTSRSIFEASEPVPVAVSYKILRRQPTTAPNAEFVYTLYRSEVRPYRSHANPGDPNNRPGVLEAGFDLNPNVANNPFYTFSSADNNQTNAGDPFSVTRPNRNSVLAQDVIDFGVRFYSRTGNQLTLLYPVGETGNDLNFFAVEDQSANAFLNGVTEPLPDVADIFVRILTPEGAKLIRNYENAPAGTQHPRDWWAIAEEHSQVFTRRINIRR